MSKLLLKDQPLLVLPALAVKVGVNGALFLQQLFELFGILILQPLVFIDIFVMLWSLFIIQRLFTDWFFFYAFILIHEALTIFIHFLTRFHLSSS